VWGAVAGAVVLAAAFGVWALQRGKEVKTLAKTPAAVPVASTNTVIATNVALPTNEVAQAIMVTVELDFGGKPPSIKDALKEIERSYEPKGERTFAILDAYGEPTPAGKLHMSMHLSMEQPGIGTLIFRRTGEVLWKSKIAAAPTGPPPPKKLTIIMDDNAGTSSMLDGSKGATHVLDVPINNSPSRVRDLWPDGAEREFTFIYSVCGCPVKTKVRRTGETTARTSEMPVMFPDDPAAMDLINQLMGWREAGDAR
jgi:hypothetical protein